MIFRLVLAFLAGLWLGSFFLYFPLSITVSLLGLAVTLACLERWGRIPMRQGILLFLGVMGGVGYWAGADWVTHPGDIRQWIQPQPVLVRGTIDRPVRRAVDRVILTITITEMSDGDRRSQVAGRLRLTWRNPDHPVFQGDRIQASVRLRPPYGARNPGGFHYGAYLERQGIHLVASVQGAKAVRVLDRGDPGIVRGFGTRIDRWREAIQRAATATLQEPALGLFLGMIIGEQASIPQAIRDRFMSTGTVHIISISGSHLGLIAFFAFVVVRGLILHLPASWLDWLSVRITPTRVAVLATLPLVSFYTLLAGAEIATVRSWIMIAMFLLAVWIGYERLLLPALGMAALAVLVHHPPAMYDTSFQLSYMSVLAIALGIRLAGPASRDADRQSESRTFWERHLPSLVQWAKSAWWLTLTVTVATIPLVAFHFNQVAWAGLVANLIVVPYVGSVVVPLGLLSAVFVILSGESHLPLGWLNQRVLDGLVAIVEGFSSLPFAEWHVASPAPLAIAFFYGCLVVWALSSRATLRMGCGGCAILVLCYWVVSPRLEWTGKAVRVTFLDVGQGDATVIELPDGQTIVIDAGAAYRRLDMGRAVVGPYLWDQGIRRIDHLVGTHPQWDHIGGFPWLMEKFVIGRYWSNGVVRDKLFFRRVQEAAARVPLLETRAWQGRIITQGGGCVLRVLSPPAEWMASQIGVAVTRSGTALNNQSVVTKLDCGGPSFLLTADIEREALEFLLSRSARETARVVKVPHHGARSSLYPPWIASLNAEAAVVSAGRYNRYGHPHPTVVEAYVRKGIPVYRTDRDGAVWVTANLTDSTLAVHTAREGEYSPVGIDEQLVQEEAANWVRWWHRWTGQW